MLRSASPVVRGAIAGVAGAATLALFFFIVDAVRGTPLATPAFLAGALFGNPDATAPLIALYTTIHFALFVALGVGIALILARTALPPHFLLGAVLGFLLFDVLFYAGVAATGIDVVRTLGWPEVLAGNLLAGIAVLGVLQLTAPEGTPAWSDALRPTRLAREALIAGVAGATMVASWFLVIDALAGRPFFTPAALGSALFYGVTDASQVTMSTSTIFAFTLLHYGAFIAVGALAAVFAARAERDAYVLLGATLLFVTLEVFVIGLIAIAAGWLLTELSWWTIVVANVLAAVIMGTYLWREHPALHEVLTKRSLEEPELTVPRPAAVRH